MINSSAKKVEVSTVTVLGSTGSIGTSTLDVVANHPDRFSIYALTANNNVDVLFQQCLEYKPEYAVLQDEAAASLLSEKLAGTELETRVLYGEASLEQVAASDDVNIVMAAIVGAAGLKPTLAAARAGKKVLLANKESLVLAGKLFMDVVSESNARLMPIDSEHNAIYQCLPGQYCGGIPAKGIHKILLTGSGGPFRQLPLEQFESITPEQACAHPNWDMGKKISVDSATMMNKGLELIEACWLFSTTPAHIDVVIHPQSIIHSMVQYDDGSTLAQLGNPDMRTPIAYGLAWPERIESGVSHLDIIDIARLDFEAPDLARFPSLALAQRAFYEGKTAAAALNAANEVAVDAFLSNSIGFNDIARVNEQVLNDADMTEPSSIDVVIKADLAARELALDVVKTINRTVK